MSDAPAVPDLAVRAHDAAAEQGSRPETPTRAPHEPAAAVGRTYAADQASRPETLTRAPRDRVAALGRAYAAGSGILARSVRLALSGVLLVILAGILLALLKANAGNGVVSEIHGWGRWLVGPFDGMFSFHRARVALAVNWGLAAVVYLIAGGLISRLISRSTNWRPLGGRSSIPEQEAP